MYDISVLSVVKNESKQIRKMLSSVKPLAREIIIIDTGSTDNTVEICKEFGAVVHERPQQWRDNLVCDNKNYGLGLCKHDWVICLDADEELSGDLIEDCIHFSRQDQYDALKVNRIHFYPSLPHSVDRVIRMFNKTKGYVFTSHVAPNHETPSIIDNGNNSYGNYRYTKAAMYHWAWINMTKEDFIEKNSRYGDVKYTPMMIMKKEFGLE